MRKTYALWLVLLAGLLAVMPVSGQQVDYTGLSWLRVQNQIALSDSYGISLYTPNLQLIERFVIPTCPAQGVGIIETQWSYNGQFVAVLFVDNTDMRECPDRSTSGDELQIWDFAARRMTAQIKHENIAGFAWSACDNLLAVTLIQRDEQLTSDTLVIRTDGSLYSQLASTGEMVWNPVRDELAINVRTAIEFWKIRDATPVLVGQIPDEGVLRKSIQYDKTGTRLALNASDFESNTYQIEIWDVETLQPLLTLPHSDTVRNFWWGERDLVSQETAPDELLRIWDGNTGALKTTLKPGTIGPLVWNPENTQWAVLGQNRSLELRDATTGEILVQLCERCEQSP